MRAFILIFLFFSTHSYADLCKSWSSSQKVGELDVTVINESSGLAISNQYSNRYYHVNDSGDGPYFYTTNEKGENTEKHEILNFKPKDVEDLSMGTCGTHQCLYIADIGDNKEARSHISLVLIKEKAQFKKKIHPFRQFKMKYPDRSHNAEAIAVHPNGDLYLITKEVKDSKAQSALIYKLSRKDILDTHQKTRILSYVGEINVPKIMQSEKEVWSKIVTSMSFSEDGSRVLLLTYSAVIELNFDLAKNMKPFSKWKEGVDYQVIKTELLPQQEVVEFIPHENSFVYSTEYNKKFSVAPLYKTSCSDTKRVLASP